MSNPLADRLDVTFKRGLAANVSATATKGLAHDGEPHWTTDELKLYVYDEASDTMIPVGHVPGVSGSFTVGGVTFTISNGLITSIV